MRVMYYIFFCIGVVYTVITVILGGILDGFDVGGDGAFEGVFSAFKPAVIICFFTVFGGIGLMTYKDYTWYGSLAISLLPAIVLSFSMDKFIVRPLYRAQNTSSPLEEELLGMEASVISPILEGSFGTITYTFNGNTYTSPAKAMEGERIEQGTAVIIAKIESNVFYVMSK